MHRDDGRGRRGPRRLVSALILGGTALALAGCASFGSATNASDATPAATSASASANGGDPGCTAALHDISTDGPSTVKLLAEGRTAVNKAAVELLVDGLDGAADAANSPQVKQDIKTLADAYDDYFDLTTDVAAVPLSAVLKATANLEFICR